jgi:hypothetical protein
MSVTGALGHGVGDGAVGGTSCSSALTGLSWMTNIQHEGGARNVRLRSPGIQALPDLSRSPLHKALGSLTDAPFAEPEALTIDEGVPRTLETTHICPHCSKKFIRLCDLNKHSKSHSRPFKCPVDGCRYQDEGWPTAKELERHHNDKHSGRPGRYTCRFAGCDYRSKRESNCKQHMEKTHGWTYVRSKPGGRPRKGAPKHVDSAPWASGGTDEWFTSLKAPLPDAGRLDAAQDVFRSTTALDMNLRADNSTDPHHALVSATAQSGERRLYGAEQATWVPPTTPGLPGARPSAEKSNGHMTVTPADEGPLFVDPQLCQPDLTSLVSLLTPESPTVYSHANSWQRPRSPLQRGRVFRFGGDGRLPKEEEEMTPIFPSPAQHKASTFSPSLPSHEPGDHEMTRPAGGTGSSGPPTGTAFGDNANHHTAKRARPSGRDGVQEESEEDDDDDDGEEGRPPRKRIRAPDAEDIAEDAMPCIFYHAYPDLYPPDPKDPKAPCYTQHKDISQLVRHLSRATHRLFVDARRVHSFDVLDEDYPHPVAGLCRMCWKNWEDRQLFDEHMRTSCQKVSKGKMEKFQSLYRTFCGPQAMMAKEEHDSAEPSRRTSGVASSGPGEPSSSHSRHVSHSIGPGTLGESHPADGYVRVGDFQALSKRVESLERDSQRLLAVNRELYKRVNQLSQPATATSAVTATSLAPRPTVEYTPARASTSAALTGGLQPGPTMTDAGLSTRTNFNPPGVPDTRRHPSRPGTSHTPRTFQPGASQHQPVVQQPNLGDRLPASGYATGIKRGSITEAGEMMGSSGGQREASAATADFEQPTMALPHTGHHTSGVAQVGLTTADAESAALTTTWDANYIVGSGPATYDHMLPYETQGTDADMWFGLQPGPSESQQSQQSQPPSQSQSQL